MISVDKAGETAMRIWGYPDWTNPNFPRRPRSLAGNGTGSVTLVGTASAINAALNKSTYHTTSTNQQVGNVDDTLQVSVTDQAGNTSSKSVNIDVTCFMPGTLIRTPAGDVAVELRPSADRRRALRPSEVDWPPNSIYYFREQRSGVADPHQGGCPCISPGTKTWTDALAALYARMGQSGSPTKQAAVLRKATTYLISDKSEGCPHMTMFGHWGASRSAFLCFATFSAGAHPLIGVDEQGINITQHLISCERSGGAMLISDIDLACNKQTLGLRLLLAAASDEHAAAWPVSMVSVALSTLGYGDAADDLTRAVRGTRASRFKVMAEQALKHIEARSTSQ